jgi:hypothetical protein
VCDIVGRQQRCIGDGNLIRAAPEALVLKGHIPNLDSASLDVGLTAGNSGNDRDVRRFRVTVHLLLLPVRCRTVRERVRVLAERSFCRIQADIIGSPPIRHGPRVLYGAAKSDGPRSSKSPATIDHPFTSVAKPET